MKILIFFNSFWSVSGGDMRLMEFMKFLNAKNIDFDVFLSSRADEFLFKNGVIIKKKILTPVFFEKFPYVISYFLRTFYVFYYFLFNRDYFKTVNIFYSPSDFFPDVLPVYLLMNKGQKWIQVVHHIYLHYSKRDGNICINFIAYNLQRLSFSLIQSKASKVILVNSLIKNDLLRLGFSIEKMFISSNAINVNYFDKIKKEKENFDMIFVGRLNKVKGVFDLIEIFNLLIKTKNNLKLAIVGTGNDSDLEQLRGAICKYRLDKNVVVFGFLESSKLYSMVASSKVFVFPSHEEGWGIAIAEAIALKVPVVAWDLPVYSCVFHGKILTVREGDLIEFAGAVLVLLNDDKRRLEMSISGYEYIKRYNWADIFSKELELMVI